MIGLKGGVIETISGGAVKNGLVIWEGDTIKSVETGGDIPRGCRVIDVSGCYVMPGFIDAHCHVGIAEEIYPVEGNDLNETTDPLTPHLRALDGVNLRDVAFDDAAAAGVTRMLIPPGSANVVGGQAVFVKSRALSLSEMVCRPAWGIKAALGENPKRIYGQQNKGPKTRMASAALLRQALYSASRAGKSKDQAEEMKNAALRRVLAGEEPLLLHVHRADDILTALRIKDEFGIKVIIQHGTEAFLVAEELARRKVPVCLGPLLVNRAKVEMKEVSFRNAAALHRAGVDFCMITDHPVVPVQYLGVCAALAVREGLDEETALRSITLNPARILGLDDELGTLEPGKKADLVIFSGHPLDVRSRVTGVIIDGVIWGGEG